MNCFVIMPFGDPRKDEQFFETQETIYRWIDLAVGSVKLAGGGAVTCHRSDKEVRPGEIITHVIKNLVETEVVIADLTGKNANVFYELGVRHAVKNNTILIAQNVEDIPFDLRSQRTIIYNYDPRGLLTLKETLETVIGEIISKPSEWDNPVRRYIHERRIQEVAQQPAHPDHTALNAVMAEMASLRQDFKTVTSEFREVTKAVTSGGREPAARAAPAGELSRFEGVWRGRSGSTYCVRVIDGVLFAPYCYMGDTHLTAHMYNCRIIGETLFSRFEWFGRPISGYIYLKLDDAKERLTGGWWYSENVPAYVAQDISRINTAMPGMNKLLIQRDKGAKSFPAWAEEYFREAESGALSDEFKYRAGLINRKLLDSII